MDEKPPKKSYKTAVERVEALHRRIRRRAAYERAKKRADEKETWSAYVEGSLRRPEEFQAIHIQANEHITPIDDSLPLSTKPKRRTTAKKPLTPEQQELADAIAELEKQKKERMDDDLIQKISSANEDVLTPDGEPVDEG